MWETGVNPEQADKGDTGDANQTVSDSANSNEPHGGKVS